MNNVLYFLKTLLGFLFIIAAVLFATITCAFMYLYIPIKWLYIKIRYWYTGDFKVYVPASWNVQQYFSPNSSYKFKSLNAWNLLRWYYGELNIVYQNINDIPVGPGFKLIETSDNSKNQNSRLVQSPYIFAAHPHGLFATAAIINFGFNNIFPTLHLTGHRILFYFPFLKYLCNLIGVISVSRTSIETTLNRKLGVVIFPGGVDEMLLCSHYQLDMKIDNEMNTGFLNIAYNQGDVPVFPVYIHNENKIWWHWNLPKFIVNKFKKWFDYPTALFFLGPFPVKTTIYIGEKLIYGKETSYIKDNTIKVEIETKETEEQFRTRYYIKLANLIKFALTKENDGTKLSDKLQNFINKYADN